MAGGAVGAAIFCACVFAFQGGHVAGVRFGCCEVLSMLLLLGRRACMALALLLLSATHAQDCPSSAPSRFVGRGAEVKDVHTGLVWARCSVGQVWNGRDCVGVPEVMTYADALQYAQQQRGWRLPEVKELASLLDWACAQPAIDETVFPNTHSRFFWTATRRYSAGADGVWCVNFADGSIKWSGRDSHSGAVRLLRVAHE
ncbi:DUF1566 domain-containing protein [Allofranklinella schreckenbergeri]|uniref:DUF1566 domain-containing protein n=1 Tax=Allofranklinella schreckenbergeri TaxID=1076744 RepID=A0A3M6Q7W6_9BURK|nr:DUF1566 domain-containing protein [Allofranklinella schreckenbergeri]RMW98730.1 DUF1566 domain-containing protein [Allofranklinella schreckenbergeri]